MSAADWRPPGEPDAIHAATGTGEGLVLHRQGPVAWLVLNRPEKRNALTGEMSWGMGRVLRVLSEDPTVRACVITGEGPAFCAGGDVGTFPVQGQPAATPANPEQSPVAPDAGHGGTFPITGQGETAATTGHLGVVPTSGQGAVATSTAQGATGAADRSSPAYRPARGEVYPATAIRDCPFPVIAAVNGPAAGAGFSLVLACDLAVADPGAKFGALQVQRGLVADWALAWLLVRRIGLARAQELLWSGEWIDASRAAELGLVNRIAAPGEVRAAATEWAARLSGGPSVAISLMKRQAHRALEMTLEQALELDSLMQARAFTTSDAAEGARAFREKRPPAFSSS